MRWKDGKLVRDLMRVEPTALDAWVRREDNGMGGFYSVLVPVRSADNEPTPRWTRSWSSRKRVLKDAWPLLHRTGGRLLRYGKGGWREELIRWSVRLAEPVQERKLVFALREWAGFDLKTGRRLARILNARPGEFLNVPLTQGETRQARATDLRILSLLAEHHLLAWQITPT